MDRLSALTMPVVTRVREAERRADRHRRVADVEVRRRSEVDRRKVLGVLELDDGEVVRRVETDDLGVVHASVGGRDAKRRAGGRTVEGHDVRVRHHVAVLREDRAGSGAAARVAAGGDRDHAGTTFAAIAFVWLTDSVSLTTTVSGPAAVRSTVSPNRSMPATAPPRPAAPPTIAAATMQPDDLSCAGLLLRLRCGRGATRRRRPRRGLAAAERERRLSLARGRSERRRVRADRGEERTPGARPDRAAGAWPAYWGCPGCCGAP